MYVHKWVCCRENPPCALRPDSSCRKQRPVSMCHCRRVWFTSLPSALSAGPFLQLISRFQWKWFLIGWHTTTVQQGEVFQGLKWFSRWILELQNVLGKMWGICFPFMLLLGRAFPDTSSVHATVKQGLKLSVCVFAFSKPEVRGLTCWKPQTDTQTLTRKPVS